MNHALTADVSLRRKRSGDPHINGQCEKPLTLLVRPRALTLIQPWATLIAMGLKTFETRRWAPAYRGPLLIHAGAKVDRDFAAELVAEGVLQADQKLPSMAILCVVDLWECYRTKGESRIKFSEDDRRYGDWGPNRWAWELRNRRSLRMPVGIKGQLGLWLPDMATVSVVNARLAAQGA